MGIEVGIDKVGIDKVGINRVLVFHWPACEFELILSL